MAKQDQKKKSGKPSSLHHYTSMETLVALLNNVHENREDKKDEKDENLYLTFHASNAYHMNDKAEGNLLLDKFFTDSKIKTTYKELYTKLEEEEGGMYVIPFCRPDKTSKDSSSIPMWNTYGKNGTGAILVFDFDKLEKHIDSKHERMSLHECQYKNTQEFQELTKNKNNGVKNAKDDKEKEKEEFLSSLFGLRHSN